MIRTFSVEAVISLAEALYLVFRVRFDLDEHRIKIGPCPSFLQSLSVWELKLSCWPLSFCFIFGLFVVVYFFLAY